MKQLAAKSPDASRLRQRKYALVRQHNLPESLIGGSLVESHRRCGRANCRCADATGHPQWTLTTSRRGKRRVERIPRGWVADIERAIAQTQAYVDALKEVMAINVELLAIARAQERARSRTRREKSTARGKETINISRG